MSCFRPLLSKLRVTYVLGFVTISYCPHLTKAQEDGPPPPRTPEARKQAQAQDSHAQQAQATGSNYDKALFKN